MPLHAHDTFGSIGDSILKIPEYVKKAKELGIKALALTNHGSMSTFVNFYEECIKNDIKPIIGCEVYYADNRLIHDKEHKQANHLILLAKNNIGLENLIKIHNDAHNKGFYYKPRTDMTMLEKYHEGLICLSGCLASPLNTEPDKRIVILNKLKAIFKQDFYLEIQPGSFKEQILYNNSLALEAKTHNIELVATNDIHYLNQEDAAIHDYHVKESRKMAAHSEMVYPDTIYYLMNGDEIASRFVQTINLNQGDIDRAIANTVKIADKCSVNLDNKQIMPHYSDKIDEDVVLRNLCYKSLENKHLLEKYAERLDYELSVIKTLGFSGYFLIVKDIIDFCDQNDIARGPGRGSAVGSLVSYLLNISIADPIQYNLMFERFLSVNRTGFPDIDLDISPEKRPLVYQHIIQRYGSERCCFVSTFNIRKARNAIKAACRLLGYEVSIANLISKKIPYVNYDDEGEKHVNISIREAFNTVKDFRKIAEKYPDIVKLADKLEGYPCSIGIHPAGIVISPIPVINRYPLIKCKNESLMATSLDLKDVEKLSGIKFDLLALSSLKAIDKTLKEVKVKFDYNNKKLLNDPKVWKLIGSKNTTGLFQISSMTYKTRMPLLKPQSIQELANCLALVRGPCISSGADKRYIEYLSGTEEPQHIHDIYWEATKDTYGVVIYQEQILKICINIGFDSETAYKILKAVSKKKINLINEFKQEFYKLGIDKKIEQSKLDLIWAEIVNAGLYAFNTAHAVSYALVCYCSAWLKTYYPVVYLKNLLNNQYDKTLDQCSLDVLLAECKRYKIKFLNLDIRKSDWNFKIEDNKIRIGFCALKGVGETAYDEIKEYVRKTNGKFTDHEFLENIQSRLVNKRVIQMLIGSKAISNDIRELADYYFNQLRKEKKWDGSLKLGNYIQDITYDSSIHLVPLYGSDLFEFEV